MIDLLCYYCVCTVISHKIVGCQPCGQGSYEDLVNQAKKHVVHSGEILTMECVPSTEKPSVDWSTKPGWKLGDGLK